MYAKTTIYRKLKHNIKEIAIYFILNPTAVKFYRLSYSKT